MSSHESIEGAKVPIKAWTRGVPFETQARTQILQTAQLPIVGPHIAVMPDVHLGIGATVGSVIPTRGAIIPAAVGVDIGCGMTAVRTTLRADQLPDNVAAIYDAFVKAVPHGGAKGDASVGVWGTLPQAAAHAWRPLSVGYDRIVDKHRAVATPRVASQVGTLGGGNHFLELCIDEADRVWIMLHSGSRGVGNRIGTYFVERAKKEADRLDRHLPNRDLAWLDEGSEDFRDYVDAVWWAQAYASANRQVMMDHALVALESVGLPQFHVESPVVSCHHNYVSEEEHFGERLYVTRKGAVSAREGELGIIPGSMGTRSFIVRGRGNADSFHSCSHGAGRVMARGQAKRTITLEQHAADTAGIVCRKDAAVIDESPRAYKPIEAVMAAQADLVDVVHELQQVLCVKG